MRAAQAKLCSFPVDTLRWRLRSSSRVSEVACFSSLELMYMRSVKGIQSTICASCYVLRSVEMRKLVKLRRSRARIVARVAKELESAEKSLDSM